jgi:CheY-like chemotaxis protein
LDLNQLINDFHPVLERLCGAGIKLDMELDPSISPARIAASGVQQVLLNLVANARDAMPDGGRLLIRTAEVTPQPFGSQSGWLPRQYVVVTVKDCGKGIPREIQSRIFDPFFTTKPAGVGTGLGLATVYGIISQRGGWIDVDSQAGKGATFSVYLPSAERNLDAKSEKNPETLPVHIDGACLVVGDQADVREVTVQFLRSQGCIVLEAADAFDALRVSRNYSGAIELLISEALMPRLSGVELAAQIRSERPDIAVLLVTGNVREASPVENGTPVLASPFSKAQLLAAAAAALQRKSISRSAAH